jgi:hypothetical protein
VLVVEVLVDDVVEVELDDVGCVVDVDELEVEDDETAVDEVEEGALVELDDVCGI